MSLWSWFRDFTYNEAHLMILGFYSGFVAIRPKPRQFPSESLREALRWEHNSWYWKGMYVVGYALKAILTGLWATGNLGALTL